MHVHFSDMEANRQIDIHNMYTVYISILLYNCCYLQYRSFHNVYHVHMFLLIPFRLLKLVDI